jgi:hypothetical protein
MCERPVRHRLLQQRAFEDGLRLCIRQFLEMLRSLYIFGDELDIGTHPWAGAAFHP